MNMVCKCGGKEFFTEEHGNQTGLYCFDFAAYSAGVALKEFGRCIKEAFGGTDKEVDDVCDSEH